MAVSCAGLLGLVDSGRPACHGLMERTSTARPASRHQARIGWRPVWPVVGVIDEVQRGMREYFAVEVIDSRHVRCIETAPICAHSLVGTIRRNDGKELAAGGALHYA